MQRVDARGSVAARDDSGKTRLAGLFQEGAAKIRLPKGHGNTLEAVLINTAGGMTGGDRLSWKAEAGEGAHLSLTTQACEKVYKAGAGTASVDIALQAGPRARLAWLPQETILFDNSALKRNLNVDLAGDAECLMVEGLVLGRKAMGETVRQCAFHDRWRIRVDGRLVHAEDFRFAGDAAKLFERTATGRGNQGIGAGAMATVLFVGKEAESRLGDVRRLLAAHPMLAAGVSTWQIAETGKLLARMVAEDGYQLRTLLQPLIRLLNGEAGLPRIWTS